MRAATALAVAIAFGVPPDDGEPQIPLPIPSTRPVLPAPVESGPTPKAPLRERPSQFLQAVVEVIAGDRPARQLAGWLAEDVFRALERRSQVVRHQSGVVVDGRRGRAR